MMGQISIKTKVGWISAFENKGKIFKIKFGRLKSQKKSKILQKFKKNIIKFFNKKTLNITTPHEIKGNIVQNLLCILRMFERLNRHYQMDSLNRRFC